MKNHQVKAVVELHKKATDLEKLWNYYENTNGSNNCSDRPKICFKMVTEHGESEVTLPHLETRPDIYCDIMSAVFDELQLIEKKIESL